MKAIVGFRRSAGRRTPFPGPLKKGAQVVRRFDVGCAHGNEPVSKPTTLLRPTSERGCDEDSVPLPGPESVSWRKRVDQQKTPHALEARGRGTAAYRGDSGRRNAARRKRKPDKRDAYAIRAPFLNGRAARPCVPASSSAGLCHSYVSLSLRALSRSSARGAASLVWADGAPPGLQARLWGQIEFPNQLYDRLSGSSRPQFRRSAEGRAAVSARSARDNARDGVRRRRYCLERSA